MQEFPDYLRKEGATLQLGRRSGHMFVTVFVYVRKSDVLNFGTSNAEEEV
jgi:hypothetical protein